MTFRRRSTIPGLPPEAVKEIVAIQDAIVRTIEDLRGESVGATTDSKTSAYSAKYNEFIRTLPPAAGIDITFPVASATAQNRWIWILKTGGGNVRLRATSGKINGVTTVQTLTAAGLYIYQSDGLDSWWSTAGGAASLAATLVVGNTTGGRDIVVSTGDQLTFANPGASPPGGDISAVGDLSLESVGDMHLHPVGGLHLGHTGSTNVVHVETDGDISLIAGTDIVSQAAASVQAQAGTFWSASTGGTLRITIEPDGSWNVGGSNGAVGNVLTSQGAGAPPTWSPAGGGALTLLTTEVNLGGLPGWSGSFTIAGAGMTVGKPVFIQQAAGPYTGKGSLADEAEDQVTASAVVTSAVLITAYWSATRSPVVGNVKFNYAVSA